MHTIPWAKELPLAITVCDPQGITLYMNDKAALTHQKDGGYDLIGRSLINCHPEPARSKLQSIMAERRTNIYTIEKNGQRKLIYQTPWFENGEYQGFVELSLVIPWDMPHFVRK